MLLRKLGGNLYCLRLSNCEPCNGYAQSDMQLKATKSRRNQVSPNVEIISNNLQINSFKTIFSLDKAEIDEANCCL